MAKLSQFVDGDVVPIKLIYDEYRGIYPVVSWGPKRIVGILMSILG